MRTSVERMNSKKFRVYKSKSQPLTCAKFMIGVIFSSEMFLKLYG